MDSSNIYNQFFKVDEKFIEILKRISVSMTVDNETEIILRNINGINYCETWNETIPTLDNNQLIDIFKGIVVVEKHFQWTHGSAATGVWLYKEISKRQIDRNLELANWSFLFTDNSYIPFGFAGNIRFQSKNAFDYVRNTVGFELLNNGYTDLKKLNDFVKYRYDLTEEAIEKVVASRSYIDELIINELNQKINSVQEKINKLEEIIKKINNEKHDLKQRVLLSKSIPLDKAKLIIGDDTRPVYFYSSEIEEVMRDKSVSKELLMDILSKFRENENASNNVLKDRLINEINNR